MTMDVDGRDERRTRSSPQAERDPFRCKLYKLGKEEVWEDLGTGFVKVESCSEPPVLLIVREVNDPRIERADIICSTPILSPEVYQLQGDPGKETIILWEDDVGQDFALSLEDQEDTKEIWKVVRGNEKRDVGALGPPARKKPRGNTSSSMPIPSFSTLTELQQILNRALPFQAREALAMECMDEHFLDQLRQVFRTAEETSNAEALGQLFHICKGMFLLGRTMLTERLLRKDCYADFVGMLEDDDGIPVERQFPHRKILDVDIKFRSVLSFTDEAILDKIHLNYRMMYLRDHILPRMVDDSVFMVLLQQIYQNTSSILAHLEQNPKLLDQLFSQVKDGDLQSLDFIQDCCRQMRTPGFGQQERDSLYSTMVKRNLFQILVPFIKERRDRPNSSPSRPVPHANCRAIALDILHMHAYHNPSSLQKFSVKNTEFLAILINLLIEEEDEGIQSLAGEIVRWIMDFGCSHNLMAAGSSVLTNGEREDFLTALYDRDGPLPSLVNFFRQNKVISAETPSRNFAMQMICEVIVTGLQKNDFQSKHFVINSNFPVYALRLLNSDQKFLHHAVIRVIKALVKKDDEQCTRYLIKNDIFKPLILILEAFLNEKKKLTGHVRTTGNIVVSSILDTLNMVREGDQKELLKHLCETYTIFQVKPPFAELEKLVSKHERNKELANYPPENFQCGAPATIARFASEEDLQREEKYFNESDEELPEEDDEDAPPLVGLLLAYEPEDEVEEEDRDSGSLRDNARPTSPTSERKRLKRDLD